jgi:acetyltransferase-like isoleucine patch superfamily enzyme
LCSDSRFTALGINHSVVLRTTRRNAKIVIGSDIGVSGGTICAEQSIIIGNECLIGANVTLVDNDFHAITANGRRFNNNESDISAAPVVISNNVFLGAQSIILKGVVVGENSIVGAGTILTSNVDADVVVAGSPTKIIKKL